jgi:hypothetical protein
MPGHARVTMASRQADLDQKSVRRKNQNERPFPDHSADRAVWAANNWNNFNGAAAPGQLRPTSTGTEARASRLSTGRLPESNRRAQGIRAQAIAILLLRA